MLIFDIFLKKEYMASIMKGSAKIDKFTISDPEEELWKTLFENNEDKFQALLESNTCKSTRFLKI